jgi:predicted nucleic acid-binding protein
MPVVVDANILVYCVVQRPISHAALGCIAGADLVIAPSLILVEVANTLAKYARRKDITVTHAQSGFSTVARLLAEIATCDHLMPQSLELGLQYAHPPADFVYVLLARERRMKLVTADARLLRKLAGTDYGSDVLNVADWK